MKKKFYLLILSLIAVASLNGADDFKFSVGNEQNGSGAIWRNQFFRLTNHDSKNNLMELRDGRDNANLMIRSWLWYPGRSPNPNQRYFAVSEENSLKFIGCSGNRKADQLIVDTKYQSLEFDVLRQTTLYANKPFFRLNYTLTAREDNSNPGSFNFPMLMFDKSFDTVIYNLDNSYSSPMAYEKVKNTDIPRSHIFVLINRKLKRSIIIMANLNTALDNGFQSGMRCRLSSSWARSFAIKHPYLKPKTLKRGAKISAEVAIGVFDGIEMNEAMKNQINQMQFFFNFQIRFHELRSEAIENEQKVPSVLASSLGGTETLKLWSESSMKKVYPVTAIPKKSTNSIVVKSAKNEGESFQIVLNPVESSDLLSVQMTPPVNNSGKKLNNIYAYFLEYQTAVKSIIPGLSNKIADKLVPIKGALPRQLEAKKNQPLWFTVDVPANVDAGRYQGKVIIKTRTTSGKKSTISIPYVVEVWNFALPKHLPFRTFGCAWNATGMKAAALLGRYHYNNSVPNLNENGKEKTIGQSFNYPKCTKMTMESFFDAAKKADKEWQYNAIMMPFGFLGNALWTKSKPLYFGKLKISDPEFERRYYACVKMMADRLRSENLLEQSFIYPWDEVFHQHYPAMRKSIDIIRRAAPDLKILTVGVPTPEVTAHNDIVVGCDYYNWWDAKSAKMIQDARKKGKEFWIYLNGTTFVTGNPAAVTRLVPWQCWPRGITGYLQWATATGWEQGFAAKGQTWLLYPYKTGEEPMAAVRLEFFRDGIEDFTYFELMKKLPLAQQKCFKSKILELVPIFGDMKVDIKRMHTLREKLGEALSK